MRAKTVAVVDYGSGNLRSVSQAVAHVASGSGLDVVVTSHALDVFNADRVILPGQGHISDCMRQLAVSGLLDAVLHAAATKPLFGVCVGMQMLLDRSEEGSTNGLGLIPGEVVRFRPGGTQHDGSRLKVPQMGWNQVLQVACTGTPHPLWQDIPDASYYYFVHSYYAKPEELEHVVSETDYGGRFASAIARENIFATQFHPEKSAAQGLMLYRNFLHWNP